ncbi:MAG: site-specific DNA-methyltransferase [candidate division Zixibacteria bacterium]|nr:site-specific DNA-methyltransferase [candidate division Zixibacteria bacterium]MDH4032607.1 site-specific DNA-methyltransferase [candidate division Zixibacteria bacterium]
MAKKKTTKKKIESIRHKDKRTNIPTEELRDFVAEDEKAPETVLYPRDSSLDPQLVWKGKDEQDREDLAVPAVPVYIQEKIHPQAIMEDIKSRSGTNDDDQLGFWGDFNGIDAFDRKVDFYNHGFNWSNRMILGDSLLVMTSLAEKEGLKGKVQTIYIDPPYGIKFGSNWQVSTRKRDVKDGKAADTTRQPEQVHAYRDTWKLGIHSYLAYLRDRLVVSRELLTETGSIFVQIGDENVHLVRSVMDEVFGAENFVALIFVAKTSGFGDTTSLASVGDYLIWYAKSREVHKYRQLFIEKTSGSHFAREYRTLESPDGLSHRTLTRQEIEDPRLIPPNWRRFRPSATTSQGATPSGGFDFDYDGVTFHIPSGQHWKTTQEGMFRLGAAARLMKRDKSISYIRYFDDFPVVPRNNNWIDVRWGFDAADKRYVVETNPGIVARCLLMTSDPGDLVLDPTCGSGTTAFVAEQWGRRWITCDTSRVALALARTRLMAAKYPYYLLADTPEGIKKEAELTGQMPPEYKTESDIKRGFVYKRVPHVTLKSIANNTDIKEGMTREEIDKAIARHADSETLYDQPYEDNKRVRVAGQFTVESLSPHRVLSTADDDMDGTVTEQEARKHQDFASIIIENLKKAGVQNTIKNERMKFDYLDTYAGTWIHSTGEYTDSDGKVMRVAVSIGPEHGTVGPMQVKEAAKEAVQGVGYDILIVCGFAFDPHVAEETKRYGKLTVLPARMNPDLAMGDELLKKTGAGNLFMVFGEPDVQPVDPKSGKIKPGADGKVQIEIKGVDVYDPTTGQIRNSTTDDIACWFIDTDYNGESFFVRHAYFTGGDEPYQKLKRALKAEIDEDAWQSLYSTQSRPFDPPQTGKIAVKVINHYGDEVLKVFDV